MFTQYNYPFEAVSLGDSTLVDWSPKSKEDSNNFWIWFFCIAAAAVAIWILITAIKRNTEIEEAFKPKNIIEKK